jgi:N-acetylglucosamine kinase-like BadF-type ATPase
VGVVIGVDGGGTKTELVAVTTDGELLARVRGPGSNSHAIGAHATALVVADLVREAAIETPAAHGAFFLCGADVQSDIEELHEALVAAGIADEVHVDNDTFALLRAGSDARDAVAVICGTGINCVGRRADGRVARYPALGWETGDWGGAEMLGREALFLAARAEDGRGEPTVIAELIRTHFRAPSVEALGIDIHYRNLPQSRLAELVPAIVAAAASDAVASSLLDRVAAEIDLFVRKVLRDLELDTADVVLGGGMLQAGGTLVDRVVALLPPGSRPLVLADAPVAGAALAALDAAGAADGAKQRLREQLRG